MSARDRTMQDMQPAFVLHRYPFRETSFVAEMFTRDLGRVPVIARGARRPKSALRGVLLAFQPLLISWTGKTELRTLQKAERQGRYLPLRGLAVMCGFYLNELLLKLLARDDPHDRLFRVYSATIEELASGAEHVPVLRRFEKCLLSELGYALTLDHDVETGKSIAAERRYTYIADRGPVPLGAVVDKSTVELTGQTLIDMNSDDYSSTVTQQQSKALLRMLLQHCLGGQTLHTRALLLDLKQM